MSAVKPFVIMLDDLMEVHPHHWPISGEGESLAEVRLLRQHSGNPKLIPREEVTMQLIENKSLINSQAGNVDPGAIYRPGVEQ
jgi:hypothetical protein